MPAYTSNITITQGEDFSKTYVVQDGYGNPRYIGGYEFVGKIRKHYGSNTSYDFEIEVISDQDSLIKLKMSNLVTKRIPIGRYFFDVKMVYLDDGNRSNIITGMATINGSAV